MPLIKDGVVVDDPWSAAPDDVSVADGCATTVTLDQWRDHRDALVKCNAPLGIRLKASESPAEIAEDLDRFGLVALEFPIFRDGRAFSYARILRERYGFTGEIRAVGDVVRDLAQYMHRSGFDAYEVKDEAEVEGFLKSMHDLSLFYQRTGRGEKTITDLRAEKSAG